MNKAKVEGSICQTYISKKTSNFCSYYFSYYFESYVQSKRTRVGRNDDSGESLLLLTLSIFKQLSCAAGRCKGRWLTGSEWTSVYLHIR